LEQLDVKLSLPKSVEEEISDPVTAEAAYESAESGSWTKVKTWPHVSG
jgi:hypothetical protein